MKFKLFAVFFALVLSVGIISHETSHYELDHGDHDHADHSVELSEDCSTCLAEQNEFVQEETTHQPSATISDFLVVKRQGKSTFYLINSPFVHRQKIKF